MGDKSIKAVVHFKDKTVRIISVFLPPPQKLIIGSLDGSQNSEVELSGMTRNELPVYYELGCAMYLKEQEEINEFFSYLGKALQVLKSTYSVKNFLEETLSASVYREIEASFIVALDAYFEEESD